jgi:hypothetical protein
MSIHQFGNSPAKPDLPTPPGTERRKPARTKQQQYGSAVYRGSNHREDTERRKIMQIIPAG